jgi:hypothetical protein
VREGQLERYLGESGAANTRGFVKFSFGFFFFL